MRKTAKRLVLARETLHVLALSHAAGGITPKTGSIICSVTGCSVCCNNGTDTCGGYTAGAACTGATQCATGGACTAGVQTDCAC